MLSCCYTTTKSLAFSFDVAKKCLFGFLLAAIYCPLTLSLEVSTTIPSKSFSPSIVSPDAVINTRTYVGTGNLTGVRASVDAVPASGYSDGPFLFVNITAPDHYGAGRAYGALLHNESLYNINALLNHEFHSDWQRDVLELFLDVQYDEYLSKALTQEYLDEIQGVEDAGQAMGNPKLGIVVKQALTLASIAVGDVESDILTLIENELFPRSGSDNVGSSDRQQIDPSYTINGVAVVARIQQIRQTLAHNHVTFKEAARSIAESEMLKLGRTCSFWGAWNSRTHGGDLYSGRNLDWAAKTGVSKYKTITIYHIGEEIPHASIAFAGLIGAITGMSAAGITVHEAGDDNKLVTLEGFPWSLRLRAVMATAHNLAEARSFWKATNNTMGLNHGIGSAVDPGFLALETRAGYSAYFSANDAREAEAEVNGTKYGFPMPDAVWRTNHPYDPKFIETMVGKPQLNSDSQTRYQLLHDTFQFYADSNITIQEVQAVNLTAVVGDKGGESRSSFVTCGAVAEANGENIVSATFHPASRIMYVAFEDGGVANTTKHVPGCCNNYVKLDMNRYFGI
jgi:hypothetical protein